MSIFLFIAIIIALIRLLFWAISKVQKLVLREPSVEPVTLRDGRCNWSGKPAPPVTPPPSPVPAIPVYAVVAMGLLCAAPTSRGQNLFVATANDAVGEYNAITGATINAALISGLNEPEGMAISGSNLFVANFGNGTVDEYNATTGAATGINASFITGLDEPEGLVLSGSTLYVANSGNGTVGEYNATTGAAISASFITGLLSPSGLAISGNTLYVSDSASGTVAEYNAITGAAISTSFITGLQGPGALASTTRSPGRRSTHHS